MSTIEKTLLHDNLRIRINELEYKGLSEREEIKNLIDAGRNDK
ncbi:hypothetical protein [Priestia megaterium]|nr:hypothetical protein [Priestia megaterium]